MNYFHPLITKWFDGNYGKPTDIQEKAWPVISGGNHTLIVAPTGSGKTLAAFMSAINSLVRGDLGRGQTYVLYVSPLKALNNDIMKNLLNPLKGIEDIFKENGESFPKINVMTRSGDTTAEERRNMKNHPPEILITTPESLNIMLSSGAGIKILQNVRIAIIDEIHAVIGSKRGTHLITAIDRLAVNCGDFQRIAMTATIRPENLAADFIGGYIIKGNAPDNSYIKRNVRIIRSDIKKNYNIGIKFPGDLAGQSKSDPIWKVMAVEFKNIIKSNRTTLFFANNRGLTEKIARLINENEPELLAYPHHGSISRELRLEVENRLKNHDLRAIIATSTLELGIDIGELDEVVLIQSPLSIASAMQRIGRAGHGVGEVSRGTIYPTGGKDLYTAAVIAKGLIDQDIEPAAPPDCPLDVLSQVIVSMALPAPIDIDELYAVLKSSYPYRNLSRKHFDLVLDMLAGRYADSRRRELNPRISIDKVDNVIKSKEGSAYLLYTSGGTIPDRGYYNLKISGSIARIGELDEEFVWERKIGESFIFGTQAWRIEKITNNDVEVIQAKNVPGIIPFWKAEEIDRGFHLSERLALFLETADSNIVKDSFRKSLTDKYFMEESLTSELIKYLKKQIEISGSNLPHRHNILIEHITGTPSHSAVRQTVIHTIWGACLNRPFAYAISAAYEEKYGKQLDFMPTNDSILLLLPPGYDTRELFSLVSSGNIEKLLRKKLESTGFFGARFRENAGRALLLPRGDFKRRFPLWLNRLRASRLMEAVLHYPDFPILLETWRTCIMDDFDLTNLKRMLDEVSFGEIKLSEINTSNGSPFCGDIIWKETNRLIYGDDTPVQGTKSNLNDSLMNELLESPLERPKIPADLSIRLTKKLQRSFPGFTPEDTADLIGLVHDRILIPEKEWDELLFAIESDRIAVVPDLLLRAGYKIIKINLPQTSGFFVCSLENLNKILSDFSYKTDDVSIRPIIENKVQRIEDFIQTVMTAVRKMQARKNESNEEPDSFTELLSDWLTFYGPLSIDFIKLTLGISSAIIDESIREITDSKAAVTGSLLEGSTILEICDFQNYERLLRMARSSRRPSFKPLPASNLQLYIADWQGLTNPAGSMNNMQSRMEQLFGYSAPVQAWEEWILPVRIKPYYKAWLDSLISNSDLVWFGCGRQRLAFSFENDLELFRQSSGPIHKLLPSENGSYSFFEIMKINSMQSGELSDEIWKQVWKGNITCDSFETIRAAIRNRFKPFIIEPEIMNKTRGPGRRNFSKWTSTRPISGSWRALSGTVTDIDLIEENELIKERIRILFNRYGIIFREVIANELPPLGWGKIFRVMRLMELSGEIISGYFFEGIPGPQFMTAGSFNFLRNGQDEKAIYQMSAADPASLCGIELESLKGIYPKRILSNHIVFQGTNPVIISSGNFSKLNITVHPDHPQMNNFLEIFKTTLLREFNPPAAMKVETINGEKAGASIYKGVLLEFGFTGGYNGLTLWKKY